MRILLSIIMVGRFWSNRIGRTRTQTYTIVPYSMPIFPSFFGIISFPFCDGFVRVRQHSADSPNVMANRGRAFRQLPRAAGKFRGNAATNLIFPEIAFGIPCGRERPFSVPRADARLPPMKKAPVPFRKSGAFLRVRLLFPPPAGRRRGSPNFRNRAPRRRFYGPYVDGT